MIRCNHFDDEIVIKLIFPSNDRKDLLCNNSFFSYQQQQSKRYHTENYDVAIVGGGIVGMATARELMIRYPKKKFILLEKEPELGIYDRSKASSKRVSKY